MKVLITGGAGYVGSTTARALEIAGHTPVILDSLVTGPRAFVGDRIFYEGDIADRNLVSRIFREHADISHTVHMAALVVVPESVERPYAYYRNNVAKSLELFDQLAELGKPRVLFSSSAAIYASGAGWEVDEGSEIAPTSPYASTKAMTERILQDLCAAGQLRGISLRYFNPVGSDPELRTGSHVRAPSHVLGQLIRTALGQQPVFRLTGTTFPTRDGSGLRDYLHVWDLAQAHVRAVERFDHALEQAGGTSTAINVGTGRGLTVLELLRTVEEVVGRALPVEVTPPRPGDVRGAYAKVGRARQLLDWQAELPVEDGVRSALEWAKRRPEVLGYP
jgi:UDP-glucose 4-epimerase